MPRLFIANPVGSGDLLGPFPLDPPTTDGEVTQTEYYLYDEVLPQGVVGSFVAQLIDARGPNQKFLVMALDMTAAPNGTYDIGDPTSDADMDAIPSNAERRAAEQLFEQPTNTFRDFTKRQIARWTIPNQPTFAATFQGVGITLFDEAA